MVLLAFPASASAAIRPFSAYDDRTASALYIASTAWNDACLTGVDLRWTNTPLEDGWMRGAVGGAYDRNPNAHCRVWAATDARPDLEANWPMFCSMLVHEFGHLTGRLHSDDPNDIMYPTLSDLNLWPGCGASPPAVVPRPKCRLKWNTSYFPKRRVMRCRARGSAIWAGSL
jgi:hypothetical protein